MVNSLRQPGDRQSIVINFRKRPTVSKSGPNIRKTEGTEKKKNTGQRGQVLDPALFWGPSACTGLSGTLVLVKPCLLPDYCSLTSVLRKWAAGIFWDWECGSDCTVDQCS